MDDLDSSSLGCPQVIHHLIDRCSASPLHRFPLLLPIQRLAAFAMHSLSAARRILLSYPTDGISVIERQGHSGTFWAICSIASWSGVLFMLELSQM